MSGRPRRLGWIAGEFGHLARVSRAVSFTRAREIAAAGRREPQHGGLIERRLRRRVHFSVAPAFRPAILWPISRPDRRRYGFECSCYRGAAFLD